MAGLTQGVIQEVNVTPYGDALAATPLLGDTVLQLNDADDFSEDGGMVVVNGNLYEYDTADHEALTITLSNPLPVTAEEEDGVEIATASGVAAVEWTAEVLTPGGDETITVTIPTDLVPYFTEGDDLEGELVALEPDPMNPGSYQVASQPSQQPKFDGAAVWNPYISRRAASLPNIPSTMWVPVTAFLDQTPQGVTVEPDGSVTIIYPGFYVADATPSFSAASIAGSRGARFMVNGIRAGYVFIPADPVGTTDVAVGFRRPLVEGDNIVLEVQQTSGNLLDLSVGDGISPFSLYRVSI